MSSVLREASQAEASATERLGTWPWLQQVWPRSAASALLTLPPSWCRGVLGEEPRCTRRTWQQDQLFWRGLATGFYIGVGGLLCCTVGRRCHGLPPGLQDFLFGAIGFPLSIFLTIICGGQGFTPNIALGVSALLRPEGLARRWRQKFRSNSNISNKNSNINNKNKSNNNNKNNNYNNNYDNDNNYNYNYNYNN
ncbi:unnamed protein product, partial [Polarella glacialis]